MNSHHFGYLLRSNLKQNLRRHLVWIIVLCGLFASVAIKFNTLFETREDIDAIVNTLKMPAMFRDFVAVKPYATANVFASEMLIFMGIFMTFMNISLALIDTRAQEDSKLLEMIRARAVGRYAQLTAAAIEIVLINLLMGVLYTASLFAAGLHGATFQGDLLTGTVLASIGILFLFLSLVMAQLGNNARSGYFLSYGCFILFYLIRMITDVTDPKWSWLSPFGWLQKTKIYTTDTWLPVGLLLIVACLLLAAAYRLAARRDLNSGLIQIKAGKGQASRWLGSPLTLVLRTERNGMFAWLLGAVIFGSAYGSVFRSIGDVIKTNPTYQAILGVEDIQLANQALVLNFMELLNLVFIVFGVISGIIVIFRLKSDERKGYLDLIRAKAVAKTRIAGSYFFTGISLAVLIYLASFASCFFVGNTTLAEPLPVKYFGIAINAGLPAVCFFLGLACLLVGRFPRWINLLWGYLGLGFILRFFGPLLHLPERAGLISPFGWLDKVPAETLELSVLFLMWDAFVFLVVLGLIGYKQRDMLGG